MGPPFEIEAEVGKEINRRPEASDDDSYIVHPFERHVSNHRMSSGLTRVDLPVMGYTDDAQLAARVSFMAAQRRLKLF